MAAVYVLSNSGKPLMPTERNAHVRRLLDSGAARVVKVNPFTIRLNYNTPEITQSLYLGIDPGRTNIGLAVLKENGEAVFEAEVVTRNKEIPKLMKERKSHRQQRRKLKRRDKRRRRARKNGTVKAKQFERLLPGYEKPIVCHDIRNKEARFNNRTRPKGWLTPTANHLQLTHLNVVRKLKKFLPITDVVLEVNKFAFMQMDNPGVKKLDYQHGALYQKGSVKDAVFDIQDGHCLFCKNKIDHYHHVVPRHKNGSETLENRVGLCKKHHDLVHTDEKWEAKLAKKKAGLNKKYGALSVLNQIIPSLMDALSKEFPDHTYGTTGVETAKYREKHFIEKTHEHDAGCIAASVLNKVFQPSEKSYRIHQFRRHDRQACNKANIKRVYLLNGKPVAINRHKAIEQKEDSLEEFRVQHSEVEVSALTVKPHFPQYKDLQRHMPGSIFRANGNLHVLQQTSGKHNGIVDYYVDTNGNRYLYKDCVFICENQGLVFQ